MKMKEIEQRKILVMKLALGKQKKNESCLMRCVLTMRTFVLFVDVVLLGSSRFGTEFEVIRKDEV